MKNLNILLASTDWRINNRIEADLLDLCYGLAVVNLHRVNRVNEFVRQGSWKWFDLIIVAPEDLLPCPSQETSLVSLNQMVHALNSIRRQHSTPILAIKASEETHLALLEAGADNVLGVLLNRDLFREQARQMLGLTHPVEAGVSRWNWAEGLFRGLQRLTQA